jgi:hypothetical protein
MILAEHTVIETVAKLESAVNFGAKCALYSVRGIGLHLVIFLGTLVQVCYTVLHQCYI